MVRSSTPEPVPCMMYIIISSIRICAVILHWRAITFWKIRAIRIHWTAVTKMMKPIFESDNVWKSTYKASATPNRIQRIKMGRRPSKVSRCNRLVFSCDIKLLFLTKINMYKRLAIRLVLFWINLIDVQFWQNLIQPLRQVPVGPSKERNGSGNNDHPND